MPHFDALRYIAVENIVRKGEIAYNKQFSFSHNVFYSIYHLFFVLTLSQTTNFGLFQTERDCKRQFET